MSNPQMVMPQKVGDCEQIIGYQFANKDLCWEALQVAGSGISSIGGRSIPDGNKRLGVLGDTLAAAIFCQSWYEGGTSKGEWDRARQAILSNNNLQRVGFALGMEECIHRNPQNPVAISPKIMSATVAAILGAVYLDGGIQAIKRVMATTGIRWEEQEETTVMSYGFPLLEYGKATN